MRDLKIYLSGGLTGCDEEEVRRWRNIFISDIEAYKHDYDFYPVIFNPVWYYSPYEDEPYHKSEREAMEYELNELRRADLVVVWFNNPKSIGTAMEMAIAYEKRIPIIGYATEPTELHPWMVECCTRICTDYNELLKHIRNFYLKY